MKNAGAFSQNHLNLGIKTDLNDTLTSNNVIDTSQVATDTTHRPKRPYRKLYPMATRGQFQVLPLSTARLSPRRMVTLIATRPLRVQAV
jgi:hypothetical protein